MKALLYILLLASSSKACGYSELELAEQRAIVESWKRLASQNPPVEGNEEFIDKLGKALIKTSPTKSNGRMDTEKVHVLLRDRLLSIPGHAEYYRDRINRMRSKVDKYRDEHGYPHGKFDGAMGGLTLLANEQRLGFQVMEHLPSIETVRVLGNFLADDRGAEVPFEVMIETGETANNELAMVALSRLGIANTPTPPIRVSEDMSRKLESWQKWYAEVESGSRTFRFIGDDTEYDLRGPVRRSGSEDRSRGQKRSGEKSDPVEEPFVPEEKPVRFLPYLLALVFLGAGFWYHTNRKRS